MKKLISVLNEKVASWIKLKIGLHAPAFKTITISTKQPLNRR